MSQLRTKIDDELKIALKSKEQVASGTIRLIKSAVKDRDIAARDKGNQDGVADGDILSLLQTMIKQREESMKTYNDAGRNDLAQRESDEMDVIRRFLPEQLSTDALSAEMDKMIAETGAESPRDMGKVMALLKTTYPGQVDMGVASAMAKKKLG